MLKKFSKMFLTLVLALAMSLGAFVFTACISAPPERNDPTPDETVKTTISSFEEAKEKLSDMENFTADISLIARDEKDAEQPFKYEGAKLKVENGNLSLYLPDIEGETGEIYIIDNDIFVGVIEGEEQTARSFNVASGMLDVDKILGNYDLGTLTEEFLNLAKKFNENAVTITPNENGVTLAIKLDAAPTANKVIGYINGFVAAPESVTMEAGINEILKDIKKDGSLTVASIVKDLKEMITAETTVGDLLSKVCELCEIDKDQLVEITSELLNAFADNSETYFYDEDDSSYDSFAFGGFTPFDINTVLEQKIFDLIGSEEYPFTVEQYKGIIDEIYNILKTNHASALPEIIYPMPEGATGETAAEVEENRAKIKKIFEICSTLNVKDLSLTLALNFDSNNVLSAIDFNGVCEFSVVAEANAPKTSIHYSFDVEVKISDVGTTKVTLPQDVKIEYEEIVLKVNVPVDEFKQNKIKIESPYLKEDFEITINGTTYANYSAATKILTFTDAAKAKFAEEGFIPEEGYIEIYAGNTCLRITPYVTEAV